MNAFVDKVAKAIFAKADGSENAEATFDGFEESFKDHYRALAVAAVQAMREPSDEMIKIGQLPPSRLLGITHLTVESVLARWHSMIDVATKDS